NGAEIGLVVGRGEDVVVEDVRHRRRQAAVVLRVRLGVGLLEEEELELRAELRLEAKRGGPVDLGLQDLARRGCDRRAVVPDDVGVDRPVGRSGRELLEGQHHSGVTYAAVRAPSTRNVAPETYDDSSEARKRAALTISRGFARRPIGRCVRRRSYAAGSSPKM